ncbi:MAG: hypothetical protein HZB66_03365 [Candidatus Aenigmarchaeota archaeon]|nr:hypothetical protein [Candidatus Aenigmarchaeota archaeon]
MSLRNEPSERVLKIDLPDGHLYTGGGRQVWEHTGLPYTTLNYDPERHPGSPVVAKNGNGNGNCNGNGRCYVLQIMPEELNNIGFDPGKMDLLYLIKRRPHDIPASIKERGGGITGRDFYIDRLELSETLKNGSTFSRELERHGIDYAMDLQYIPSSVAFLFLCDSRIKSYSYIRNTARQMGRTGEPMRIATEFPWIAETTLTEMGLKKGRDFVIKPTSGASEGYPRGRDSEGVLEIVQTGNSAVQNGLKIVEPFVIRISTPYMTFNKTSYEMAPNFCDDLMQRLYRGVEIEKARSPELFEQNIRPDALWNHNPFYPDPIYRPHVKQDAGSLARV